MVLDIVVREVSTALDAHTQLILLRVRDQVRRCTALVDTEQIVTEITRVTLNALDRVIALATLRAAEEQGVAI